MAGTPQFYAPAQDIPIPVFQFTDIAAGTGVVQYFGAVSKDPDVGHILSEQQVYTAQRETSVPSGGPIVLNFDLTPFNLPRTAKGTAIVSCAVWCLDSGDPIRIKVTMKKVSAATTSISSQITSEDVAITLGAKMVLLKIPLTETHFKRGDILRMELILDLTTVGAIGHSPNNLPGELRITSEVIAADNIVTILKLNMPYRIDV